jgi:uncharacterized protein involved in exopolysaccharide biosynthesis
MKNTPLQKLINRLETRILKEEKSHDKFQAYKAAKAMATELLEEEKQMVVDAFTDGVDFRNEMEVESFAGRDVDAEQYFKKTYEQ